MSTVDRQCPAISVVVPAYREAERIGRCIERLRGWLEIHGHPFEILIVDDGSDDQTAAIAQRYVDGDERIRLLSYRPNRGKGFAVRRGLTVARGRRVLFTDADLSTPASAIGSAVELLDRYDVVVGTRARKRSRIITHQARYRERMGRSFNLLVRILGLAAMPDTQCGFKGFRAEALPALLEPLRTNGFAFDVELLLEARRQGLRLAELPVCWTNDPATRVRIVRDSLAMLVELLAIALRQLRRRWRGPQQ